MTSRFYVLLAVLVLIFSLAVMASAEQKVGRARLLIVDETQSLEISMRVQGLVRSLKQRPEVQVVTKIAEVEYVTENPLKGESDLSADAVIIVPSAIETGEINQVWIVTRPYSSIPLVLRANVKKMMSELKTGISKAFGGKVKVVGVNDDLIPAYFSTLFLREGVLR